MATANISEGRSTDQRKPTLDLAYECRRLCVVSNALLQGGLDNMDNDALKQSVLRLSEGIHELAQKGGLNLPDVTPPPVAAPRDYLSWVIEAREVLMCCIESTEEVCVLTQAANKLVTGYHSVATSDEFIEWSFNARDMLLRFCKKFKGVPALVNPARKLTIEHQLITACLPVGQNDLAKEVEDACPFVSRDS